jgi:hypothetical protein
MSLAGAIHTLSTPSTGARQEIQRASANAVESVAPAALIGGDAAILAHVHVRDSPVIEELILWKRGQWSVG